MYICISNVAKGFNFFDMKATAKQLVSLNDLGINFGIKVISDYGFYSNGNIGCLCEDNYGQFNVIIDKNGTVTSKQY